MNIDELTYGDMKKVAAIFNQAQDGNSAKVFDNGMNGKYVIVRCRDAGVHAGILESHNGRECVLLESRRLWYWKPANGQKYLSGVAVAGLDGDSKIGAALPRLHLSENCEIIQCTDAAAKNIKGMKSDETR